MLLAYVEKHMAQLGSGLRTASEQVLEQHATALSAPGRRMGQHNSRASHFAGGPSAQFIIHSQGEGDIPIGGTGTWWPRQRNVVAALIILHVLALVYWLWAVFRKAAAVEAHDKNKRALMEPPRKVGCTYEWGNMPAGVGARLKPLLGKSLSSRTHSWSQLTGLGSDGKAGV